MDPVPHGGPYVISVTAADGSTISIKDVMFGDVWICSGQSNMQFTVSMVRIVIPISLSSLVAFITWADIMYGIVCQSNLGDKIFKGVVI